MARVRRERDRFVGFVVEGVEPLPKEDRLVRHARYHATNCRAAEASCAAAEAEFARVKRGQATMSYTLALGRPERFPELPVTVSGFKPEIDATQWLVKKVMHTISEGGFESALELEVRDELMPKRYR